jgi:hypothetical protein
MTGIGGDCFALIGQADGTVTGLNGSGRASRHATADWLKASGLTEIATDNIHAVTVPGAVDALAGAAGQAWFNEPWRCAAAGNQTGTGGVSGGPRTASMTGPALLSSSPRMKAAGCTTCRAARRRWPARSSRIRRWPGRSKPLQIKAGTVSTRAGRRRHRQDVAGQGQPDRHGRPGRHAVDLGHAHLDGFRGKEILEIPPNGTGPDRPCGAEHPGAVRDREVCA